MGNGTSPEGEEKAGQALLPPTLALGKVLTKSQARNDLAWSCEPERWLRPQLTGVYGENGWSR